MSKGKELLEKDLRNYMKLRDIANSLNAEMEELRESIINDMDELGMDTVESEFGIFVIIPESTRNTVDRKMLQSKYPNVLKKVNKTYKVKRYLKVKEV